MARTTSAAVQGVLLGNYDGVSSLTPFIDAASSVVDQVVTCMSTKGLTAHSAATLELIERWVAAHAYTFADRLKTSKSTGKASASYRDTAFSDFAKTLDSSGCLAAILAGNRAQAFWLGRRPSEQTEYADRD